MNELPVIRSLYLRTDFFTHTWPLNVFLILPISMYKKWYQDMYRAELEEFFLLQNFSGLLEVLLQIAPRVKASS